MQPEARSAPGSTAQQEQESGQTTTRHRYPAERSARSTPLEDTQSSNAPSVSGTRRTLRVSPQQRGSSRESDMRRSSSPPEGRVSIRYTRTGRVSKATKGQRVHRCDECGKTYTRAEHLRRHQQNHKPGAFPCDIPGCGRSFYREDLLIRHKARHNDPLNPPSRRPSFESQTSAHDLEGPMPSSAQQSTSFQRNSGVERDLAAEDFVTNAPATSAQQASSSSAPRTKYIPITELPAASQVPIPVNIGGSHAEYPFGGLWEPSPPYSPTGYESPTNDLPYAGVPSYYGQPPLARGRYSSNATFLGDYGRPTICRSPASASSSAGQIPLWGHSSQSPAAALHQMSNTSSGSDPYVHGASLYNNVFDGQHLIPGFFDGSSRIMSAEERDLREFDKLAIPTGPRQGSSFDVHVDGIPYTNERRYLGAYWMWIHPLFPVVHKPSFNLISASPLLRAAMLALGAHISQTADHMANARIIHERCMKVLKERNVDNSHTYRVCDMQAILLVEVYSIFKSRRPPLQLSRDFERVFSNLALDPEALTQDTPCDTPLQPRPGQASDFFEELSADMVLRQDGRCKQRLLAACYVLDSQHATLFGRPRTTCLQAQGILGLQLPLSCSQQDWDTPLEEQAQIRFQRRVSGAPWHFQAFQALSTVPAMTEPCERPYDAFQSTLMMASLIDPNNQFQSLGCTANDKHELSPILYAVEQSHRLTLAWHTFMLCKHTPLRDLLAVAGESWIMAEKLGKAEDYTKSQLAAQDWAKGFTEPGLDFALEGHQTPVQRAFHHALAVLDIHRNHPKTGLLFQEWSIYLSAVVIWARSYVTTSEPRRKPRLSISSPTEPRPSTPELEQTVASVVDAPPTAAMSWNETKSILLWVKQNIEKVDMPHNCGLTNGALDVLGKLVARGNEEGWFG